MKRLNYIFISLLFILCFVGCSKKEKIQTDALEAMTICELEQIENISSLNDETIKALSVVIRTNLKENIDENFAYIPNNERLAKLVYSTKGETLNFNENRLDEEFTETSAYYGSMSNNIFKNKKINYTYKKEDVWTVKIKKFQILKFLNKKNINLSNMSKIEPVVLDDGRIEYIKIGSKNISYNELANEFKLKSNKILKIDNSLTEITISGLYENNFNINDANNLAIEGNSYDKIIENMLKDWKISKQ